MKIVILDTESTRDELAQLFKEHFPNLVIIARSSITKAVLMNENPDLCLVHEAVKEATLLLDVWDYQGKVIFYSGGYTKPFNPDRKTFYYPKKQLLSALAETIKEVLKV